jgi:hypothetical protein
MQSIMPEGGWIDPPQQDTQQKPDSIQRVYPAQTTYLPRKSYLICKVCDSGTLTLKTVFRMSGPAVAIGFILLIPSILGMIFSAFLFVSANSVILPKQPYQSAKDAQFRKNCKDAFREVSSQLPGVSAPEYCECALSGYKETNYLQGAFRTCAQQGIDGTLSATDHDVDAFYSSNTSHQSPDSAGSNLFRVAGSGFAIALGIASFVGGLLGWLLVMRKRVLQCNVCGAIVNAS